MGRAVSIGAGINWLTLSVIVAFHLGALAALFFFTWQRLTVMLVLYVVAINLGLALEELRPEELDDYDARFPVVTNIYCRKPKH